MGRVQQIARRLRQSYFPRDDLRAYESWHRELRDAGFTFVTMTDFAALIRERRALPVRCCVSRVDVDSDPRTALEMARITHSLGIRQTYYFRLCTIRSASGAKAARTIQSLGHEVGYHFEELASFAYKNRIASAQEALDRLPEIRKMFAGNMRKFIDRTGAQVSSVASHGDFMNRRLRQSNSILIDDEIRKFWHLACECYDEDLVAAHDSYIIDTHLGWKPETPQAAVARGARCIRVLTHPAHWRTNIGWNLRLDAVRLWQGLMMRFVGRA